MRPTHTQGSTLKAMAKNRMRSFRYRTMRGFFGKSHFPSWYIRPDSRSYGRHCKRAGVNNRSGMASERVK